MVILPRVKRRNTALAVTEPPETRAANSVLGADLVIEDIECFVDTLKAIPQL